MLTKSINEKISEEEQKNDFKSATVHKEELKKVEQEWQRIEEVNERHKKEQKQIDNQWDEIEEKQKLQKKEIKEEWSEVEAANEEKARKAKASSTCKTVNREELQKHKEQHKRRTDQLDRREDHIN